MNIKKNSFMVLGLVLGVSVILYIFGAPTIPPSTQITPTMPVPTIIPTVISTGSVVKTTIIPTTPALKKMSETVGYNVKGYPESITVNIVLDGTNITDLQLSQSPGAEESVAYQDAFASEIKSHVVGKNLKDINVSRVAGASYTTNAFMQAINKMQTNTP